MRVSESISHTGMLLKGSLLLPKQEYLDITIVSVKENLPGINSPAVIEFTPGIDCFWPDGKPATCTHWPVNKTNLMIIADLSGWDDTARWPGLQMRLKKVVQNNPQTNRPVDSLLVDRIFDAPAPAAAPAPEPEPQPAKRGRPPKGR